MTRAEKQTLLAELESEMGYVESQLPYHQEPYGTHGLMWRNRRDALRYEIAKVRAELQNLNRSPG